MPYTHNKTMEIVSLHKFMDLEAFISILECMYEVDINHATIRRQAQLRLTQLYKQAPVVADSLRFPEKYHVNLSVGKIAKALHELIKEVVLFNKDNIAQVDFLAHDMLESLNSTLEIIPKDKTNSTLKFFELLDEIREHVYGPDLQNITNAGIYNRETFEEYYDFWWTN